MKKAGELDWVMPDWILPDWPAPENIIAFTTTRAGGISLPPYDSFNVAEHVGDNPESVICNRKQLIDQCQGLNQIQWLNQVHGTVVATIDTDRIPEADASFSTQAGIACAVMTADCLPLIICDAAGRQVAAVHAGWRGLVDGIIEKTVSYFSVDKKTLIAWLGPAISQQHFEVGPEVKQAFLSATDSSQLKETDKAFIPSLQHDGHFYADLYQLARVRLKKMGVSNIYGGDLCSFGDSRRFFSYRRDGKCGRMLTLIYKR